MRAAYRTGDRDAFAIRTPSGITSVPTTAPPLICARYVITHETADRSRNGSFSAARPSDGRRRSGQKSTSRRTKGSVTSIGLHVRPTANSSSAAAYREGRGTSA